MATHGSMIHSSPGLCSPRSLPKTPFTYKIVICGDSGVGKTNLLNRFIGRPFSGVLEPTIGFDCEVIQRVINGNLCQFALWDTAGQEEFMACAEQYFRGASGCVLVYSITSPASFDSVSRHWLLLRRKYIPDAVTCVIGNKRDFDHIRLVEEDCGREFVEEVVEAEAEGAFFVEASAKAEREGVVGAFWKVLRAVHLRDPRLREKSSSASSGSEDGEWVYLEAAEAEGGIARKKRCKC